MRVVRRHVFLSRRIVVSKEEWVTNLDVWVKFPSIRALLGVMRDKIMRQALAKSKKQAVESVKSFGTLRFFDNALITMPFSHRSLLRRNKRAPKLLIVLSGVYGSRTVAAAPKQYRKTVQQRVVDSVFGKYT